MNNNKKVWTKEKVSLLLELLDRGLTYKEISRKMEFTESSIVNYMHKNNLKYRYNPTNGLIKWSEEMIEDLRSLILSREYNYKQISEILSDKYKKDIQIDSVKTATYLHLKGIKYSVPEQYWSEEQNNLLKTYISENKSYEEISRLFNREKSACAVRDQCIRLEIFQPKFRKLSKEEELDIANLFHLGARVPYIIKKYNGEISDSRVRYIAKKYHSNKLTPKQQAELGYRQGIYYGIKKDEIISLAEQGYSKDQIAKLYNVKYHVIKWFCDKFEINLSAIRFRDSRVFVLKKVLGREPTENEIREIETKSISDIIGKEFLIKTLEENYLCVDRVATFFDVDSTVIFGAISKFNINLDDLVIKLNNNDFLSGFKSYGEYCTACALVILSLKYNKEYIIKVPLYIRQSGIAKIDFCLTYNGKIFWIEYNGKQHYCMSTGFFESFEDRVKRDLYVKKRAKDEGITFIEIPYTYYSTKKIQDLLQRVIIEGEDINNIIDYAPFYKEIEELRISIDEN